jgi:hypothetical protein
MSQPPAPAGADEAAAFRQYLEAIDERARLGGLHRTRAAEVEASGRAALDAAALAERQVADTVRSVERTIDAIRPRIRRVAAQAGPDGSTTPSLVPPIDSLDACASAARSIEADLRSVESSWAWIERQRAQRGRVAPAPAPTVPSAAPTTSGEAVSSGSGGAGAMRLVAVAVAVLVVIVILLVVVAG